MLKPGLIKKIRIKDFVTYSEVEVYPGPNLNIILGPNGTGKSTVVAAIILGLGGTPKTIGRGTKVSEYVRHGCKEARIDIELESNKPNTKFTVTRIFTEDNKNTWYLNEKHVSEQEVKQATQKLNIQVSNLCQFLPQDRVQDFAKMNKKELLINTQIAVGRQDLVDKHDELIKEKEQQKSLVKDMDVLRTKLEQSEAEVTRLEAKVRNFNEKKKIIAEIENIRRKMAWINYEKQLETKETVQDERKQAERIVNTYKKRIQPVEIKINDLKKQLTSLQNKLLQSRNNLKILENKVQKLIEKAEDIENSHRDILIEMRAKLQALAEQENEVLAIRAKVDKLVNDEGAQMRNYGDEHAIDAKANELLKMSNKYGKQSEELNRQRISAINQLQNGVEESKALENKLSEMENVKLMRMQILKRKDSDAYEAVLWLQQNLNLFQGQVYEPMILELNVIDPAHSKYIENIIPRRDQVAFTCEYREDMNLLLQKVRDEKGLMINVVHSGAEHKALADYKPMIPIEQLRKFGFFSYAKSLITGPEAILKYLCRMYLLHGIPIGDQTTFNKSNQIPQQIQLFFSEKNRFAVSCSRYTGEKSTRISDVESDGTFSVCIDYNRINATRKKLEEIAGNSDRMKTKIQEFQQQLQAFEAKRSDLLKERQNVLNSKEQIRITRERLAAAKLSLENFLSSRKTADEIKQEASDKMTSKIKGSFKVHKAILNAFTEFDLEVRQEERIHVELGIVQEQISHLENDVVDLKADYREACRTYEKIDTVYKSAVNDANEALLTARNLSGGYTPEDSGFDRFRAKYEGLSSDYDILKNLINDLQTRNECILAADDGELRAFEKGQKLMKQYKETLAAKTNKQNNYGEILSKMYLEWITPLRQLVQHINENFGNYFECLGCAGEVQITNDSGEHEYADYGIAIRVTYRMEDQLQELNRYVQSGGERAVATAIYMLSLQELTAAPFRCVDEINQGMDPQNERKIFEILVRATSKPDTCQYFLITPKLVAGLPFGPGMKIHMIHNGPFVEM